MCPVDFRKKFPTIKQSKYSYSALIRIFSGYFFLINVFIVLIQAEGVIEIFYDVLALQFVQQLDDIVFNLAKIDILGKRMQMACTSPVFKVCIEKHPAFCKKSDRFLKALYFFNLVAFMSGMIFMSTRQINGHYIDLFPASESSTATATVASGSVTINVIAGKITSEDVGLAASAIDGITLYNSHITESSVVLINVADSGGCQPVVYQALPSEHSVEIKVKNFGEDACTSAYTLGFWVMN